MNNSIITLQKLRASLLKATEELTVEQLNQIPDGFRNNIIWNMGHLMAAQQALCYRRSGLPTPVDAADFEPFLTGTVPGEPLDAAAIQRVRDLLTQSLEQLQVDHDKQIFVNYEASPGVLSRYNIELKSVDDAIEFMIYHEGAHIGYILALKHLV